MCLHFRVRDEEVSDSVETRHQSRHLRSREAGGAPLRSQTDVRWARSAFVEARILPLTGSRHLLVRCREFTKNWQQMPNKRIATFGKDIVMRTLASIVDPSIDWRSGKSDEYLEAEQSDNWCQTVARTSSGDLQLM
jgi:hypothetical protein